jgi:hypothetical protein
MRTVVDARFQPESAPESESLSVCCRVAARCKETSLGPASSSDLADVLPEPLDRGEVIRSVSLAWLYWHRLQEIDSR